MDEIKLPAVKPFIKRIFFELPDKDYRKLQTKLINSEHPIEIKTWSNFLADDINKFYICLENNIPMNFVSIHGRSIREVFAEVCKNKLDEMRHHNNVYYWYLIGTLKNELVKIQQTGAPVSKWFTFREESFNFENMERERNSRASQMVGERFGIAGRTVQKFAQIANSIDSFGKIDCKLRIELLSGEIYINQSDLVLMGSLDQKNLRAFINYVRSNNLRTIQAEDLNLFNDGIPKKDRMKPSTQIKEMPQPDPDLEINSLALTVPSWIDTMNRVKDKADFIYSSHRSRQNLLAEMWVLMETVDGIIDILRRNTYE